jgi:hypothetical protein
MMAATVLIAFLIFSVASLASMNGAFQKDVSASIDSPHSQQQIMAENDTQISNLILDDVQKTNGTPVKSSSTTMSSSLNGLIVRNKLRCFSFFMGKKTLHIFNIMFFFLLKGD